MFLCRGFVSELSQPEFAFSKIFIDLNGFFGKYVLVKSTCIIIELHSRNKMLSMFNSLIDLKAPLRLKGAICVDPDVNSWQHLAVSLYDIMQLLYRPTLEKTLKSGKTILEWGYATGPYTLA